MSRSFLDRVRVETVVPAPLRTEALGDQVVYVFAGRPGADVVTTFHVTPPRHRVRPRRTRPPGPGPARDLDARLSVAMDSVLRAGAMYLVLLVVFRS